MKRFFDKLGFRKMDEMEKDIAQRSQRNALIYAMIFLMGWTFYESYKVYTHHTPLNLMPCFLLVSTSWVLILSQLFFKRQAVKDDLDYKENNPIWKFVLIVILIVGVIASLGSWFLIAGN